VLVVQKDVGGGWAVVKVQWIDQRGSFDLQGSKSLFRSTNHRRLHQRAAKLRFIHYHCSLFE
jgi:hypothetical protein